MYNVTQAEINEYKKRASVKRGYISIVPPSDEEEIILNDVEHIKDFTILDDIYTPDVGIISSVISKQLSLNLFKPSEIDLTDREVNVFIGIELMEEGAITEKYIPFGTFIIQKPENEELTEKTNFEALDYMIKFNKKYEDTITYPCTLMQLLENICNQCEIELGTKEIVNSNFIIENNQFINGETCRDVLIAILQTSTSYARIGRDNKLYVNSPNISENIEQVFDETDYTKEIKINNTYGPINRVVLKMSDIEGENVVIQDDESINEIGVKEITISDNPLTYTQSKREQVITEIWNKLRGFTYVDFEMKSISRPYIDSGDSIQINISNEQQIKTILLSHEIVFNGGLSSNMSATADTETETKYGYIPNLSDKIRRAEIIVDKANQTITSIVEEQDEYNKLLSETKSSVDSIQNQVSGIYDFTKIVKGKNEIILNDALDTNILRLTLSAENIKGATYPSKKLFPSKKIFPHVGNNAVTVVISRNSRYANKPLIFPQRKIFPGKKLFPRSNPALKTKYKFYFGSPLREYNNIHDKFVIEFDYEKGTCIAKVLRRIKKDGEIYTIYNKEQEEIIQELDMKLFKGKNYIYLKEYTNWEIEAEYMFNTELNKYYSSRVETSSKIKQMANELELVVEQETDTDKLISKINLKPGRIDMTGLVTANENFKILEDGSIEAKNGKFSGDIFLDDGSEIIGGKGLLSNLTFVNGGGVGYTSIGLYNQLGFFSNEQYRRNEKEQLYIDAYIPENFTILSAYIVLSLFPLKVYSSDDGYTDVFKGNGFAKNIRVYKSDMTGQVYANWHVGSGMDTSSNETYYEIPNALNENDGYTPDTNKIELQSIVSKDISSNLSNGHFRISIASGNDAPSYNSNYMENATNCALESCLASATLNIYGYMRL